eukprot:scaffold49383_cov27-Tisochrysis_lutea.AAC.3
MHRREELGKRFQPRTQPHRLVEDDCFGEVELAALWLSLQLVAGELVLLDVCFAEFDAFTAARRDGRRIQPPERGGGFAVMHVAPACTDERIGYAPEKARQPLGCVVGSRCGVHHLDRIEQAGE